jgi:hypothetical protein
LRLGYARILGKSRGTKWLGRGEKGMRSRWWDQRGYGSVIHSSQNDFEWVGSKWKVTEPWSYPWLLVLLFTTQMLSVNLHVFALIICP